MYDKNNFSSVFANLNLSDVVKKNLQTALVLQIKTFWFRKNGYRFYI